MEVNDEAVALVGVARKHPQEIVLLSSQGDVVVGVVAELLERLVAVVIPSTVEGAVDHSLEESVVEHIQFGRRREPEINKE